MSDIGTGGGGAAPSGGAPSGTGGAAPPAPATGAGTAPSSASPAPGQAAPGAATEARKIKFKVGGAEREMTEAEVIRLAQSGYGANVALKQAKEQREAAARDAQQAKALRDALRDPRHFREIARSAGLDEDALFDAMKQEREDNARMTPEQRAAAEDRRAAQEARAAREREEGALHEHKAAAAAQAYQTAITRTANGILAESGFKAKSPAEHGTMLASVAQKLAMMAEHNVDERGQQRMLTKGHVREAVRLSMEERTSLRSNAFADEIAALEALEDAALLQRLPPPLVERLRKMLIAQSAAKAVAPPVSKGNGTDNKQPRRDDGTFKPVNFEQRMRDANAKWKGER